MKSSYNKLAEQRDETIYQIKKALEQRRIHKYNTTRKLEEGISEKACYESENLQNSITLSDLLDALTKLYEIK